MKARDWRIVWWQARLKQAEEGGERAGVVEMIRKQIQEMEEELQVMEVLGRLESVKPASNS
jgi:hypothetical protein